MRIIAIRFVLAAAFFFALIFSTTESGGQITSLLIDSILSAVFTLAVLKFTGRAYVFVPLTVFAFTALFPFAVLCRIGIPSYGTWSASANAVLSSMRSHGLLWGGEMFVPTLVSAFLAWFLFQRLLVDREGRT